MAKYHVHAAVTGSAYLGLFEANSPEEAKEKAEAEHELGNLCHQCSRHCEDPQYEAVSAELAENE